jgi:hypothetical protein
MNCSEELLEAIAKNWAEIGLKALGTQINTKVGLLLFAELVFVVKQLQHVEHVVHNQNWVFSTGGYLFGQG